MTIDPDVARIAAHMGSDPQLIQSVMRQEGGRDALLRAVQCSPDLHVTTIEQAIEVTCRSANRAAMRYLAHQDAAGFVAAWGAKWAPLGVANDPHGLNRNWVPAVLKFWTALVP